MKKRFTEEQIIGFLREAEAGMPIKACAVSTASRRPFRESRDGAAEAKA